MVKFIDIQTGKLFNLAHSGDGVDGSAIWFDGAQSTQLIYYKQILVLSDASNLQVSLPNGNGIFYLINVPEDNNPTTSINGFNYYDYNDLKVSGNAVNLVGESYSNTNYYLYSIYVTACSTNTGQYIEELTIGNEKFNIGADFYDENESLLINMANQGQEIPQSIQRAIYEENPHEELNDNILLNRKWKELLLNSWKTFVSKGSYESLVTSLKWFEYGDLIRMSEYWKFMINGEEFLRESDITQILQQEYKTQLSNFAKTTYIGIHCLLDKPTGALDSELNPNLEKISFKWSNQEMAIKMSLLGNFYSTYFKPIHLDLLLSTIEDVVFANSQIKCGTGSEVLRENYDYKLDSFKCNIKDGQEFVITNISTQVGPNTMFAKQYSGESSYDDIYTVGVEDVYNDKLNGGDSQVKTFYSQLTNVPGVKIPVTCELESNDSDSVIEENILFYNTEHYDVMFTDYKIKKFTKSQDLYKTTISFNLIYFDPYALNNWADEHIWNNENNWTDFLEKSKWTLSMQFRTAAGKLFTKKVWFKIVDNGKITLDLYKVKSKQEPLTNEDFSDFPYSTFNMAPLQDSSLSMYTQYIPTGGDVKTNNVVVIGSNTKFTNIPTYISDNYLYMVRDTLKSDDTSPKYKYYLVCISKKFGFKWNPTQPISDAIVRNGQVYFPQFHNLEYFDNGAQPEISGSELICVKPRYYFQSGESIDLDYVLNLNDTKWIFTNESTGETIEYPAIQNPLITSNNTVGLSKGYYSVELKYKLADPASHSIKRNSVFILK